VPGIQFEDVPFCEHVTSVPEENAQCHCLKKTCKTSVHEVDKQILFMKQTCNLSVHDHDGGRAAAEKVGAGALMWRADLASYCPSMTGR
jgi:hypothetical protein